MFCANAFRHLNVISSLRKVNYNISFKRNYVTFYKHASPDIKFSGMRLIFLGTSSSTPVIGDYTSRNVSGLVLQLGKHVHKQG